MNKIYVSDKSPVDTKMPLVILVDRGSASASEIVTGAIQDLDRGVVIGQRSYGKGLVQQTVQLVYNTQMKVTIAKYYTPSGRCIQALDYFHKNPDGSVDKIADSLMSEFKTKNGRLVYDGSGIYPDVLLDAKKYSNISSALMSKTIIFNYSTKYRFSHPVISLAKDFSLTDAEYDDFIKYVLEKEFDYTTKSEKALDDFKEIAEKEQYFENVKAEYDALKKKTVHNKQEDLMKFKNEIEQLLEQEIASRYYYQNGRLETSFDTDAEVLKAISVLRNTSLYLSIVKGEGDYKVIGKPKKDIKKN